MSYKLLKLFIVLTLFGLCLSGCIRDKVPDERDAIFCTRYTNELCCNPQVRTSDCNVVDQNSVRIRAQIELRKQTYKFIWD